MAKTMKSKEVDMLSGSVTKGLITLALPIMIMNVGQMLFNVIDLTVLKIFADDAAVGAVGASGNLITLCNALLIGISVGANVVVAKRIGHGDKEKLREAVSTIGVLFMRIIISYKSEALHILE